MTTLDLPLGKIATRSKWIAEVKPYVLLILPNLGRFSVDDLHSKLPEFGLSEPAQVNDWGALVAELRNEGRIIESGQIRSTRPTRNGAKVTAWEVINEN
jgi:hypothetical protein